MWLLVGWVGVAGGVVCSGWGPLTGDVAGAFVVGEELVAVGAGPQEAPGFQDRVGPGGVGFESMVAPAQGCEVARAGGAALVVGDDVVAVGGPGWAGAPGEHAGAGAQDGLFAETVGDLIALDAQVVVEVDDWFHDHLGVGVGAPGPDLVGGDALVVVLHPGQVQTPARSGAFDGCFGEVDVEDHLTRFHRLAGPVVLGAGGVEVEGELVPGELSGGDRAAYVQGVGRPAGFEGFGTTGQGGVEVQGIGEVELALDPAGAGEGDLVMVDVQVPPLGGGVSDGLCKGFLA